MMIYTNQRSKLSKKQRLKKELLLKQQREIKRQLLQSKHKSVLKTNTLFIDNHRDLYPSLTVTRGGLCTKRESNKYTGDEMIGIGQLHKSNAIPVFRTEDAKDLARMRR